MLVVIGLIRPSIGSDLFARVVLLVCRLRVLIRCRLVGIWLLAPSVMRLLGISRLVLTAR